MLNNILLSCFDVLAVVQNTQSDSQDVNVFIIATVVIIIILIAGTLFLNKNK